MKRKAMSFIMCAVLTCTSLVSFAAAAETITVENIEVVASETNTVSECSTRAADLIVYCYKVENGNIYYRRWNDTQGYWVDSYWVYLGKVS